MPAGEAYSVATVVARSAPISAHVGDRAIVHADGRIDGFVGGACARDIVRRYALRAMTGGAPLLVQIRPDAKAVETADGGARVIVPMTCTSEGAVDVYIEPQVAPRIAVVCGLTPVAAMVAALAQTAGFDVRRVLDAEEIEAGPGDGAVPLTGLPAFLEGITPSEMRRAVGVVATAGHYDEQALDALLRAPLAYVGLMASRKRASAVFASLRHLGLNAEQIARVRNPAGLDLGAKDAAGVAISILAEIVALPQAAALAPHVAGALAPKTAIDPICGMEVEIDAARYTHHRGDQVYYFCCAGCRDTFAA